MMKGESQKVDRVPKKFSLLLELSASNDLVGFKTAIEEEGRDIDEPSLWYGRRIGSRKMEYEERTPLLIASMFGSKDVVNYIVESGRVDVNQARGSDGATALHCAVVGGSFYSTEVVRILLDASADTDSLDANGNRPVDLIAPACNSALGLKMKMLESLLKASGSVGEIEGLPAEIEGCNSMPRVLKQRAEKKEYTIDLTLPDIKSEIYGTDEFRMYNFKVTPCSRAYSHDWTECPFAHPGENARRRDPRKYIYSCVPCPEFRKGSCKQGDSCEYAHGVFECWLHPAQYRTRLCKDGTNCNRKVCFFAHKPEELRPLYASTGSAVPSPRCYSATGSSLDMGSTSPHGLGSPSVLSPPTSTPPLTPPGTSSPMAGMMWPSQSNIVPSLQLHGSRLKSARRARNMELNMDQLGLESHRRRQTQQLIDEIPGLSSSTNLESYPMRPTAATALSPRPTAFPNRSSSFMEHTSVNHHSGFPSPSTMPCNFSDWGSADGNLDWSILEELNILAQSSFVFESSCSNLGDAAQSMSSTSDEPDVSWVQSLVKDTPSKQFSFEDEQQQQQSHLNTDDSATFPAWVEQYYMEQEQMLA
ncbi:tandem zinc finger protein 9 [Hibiscus trionum]|uniref:Tandem zinc finger protein 9 n=1 Tax=Hibiscus trionum TaxID=183268 RepID=A0A9W7IJD1_HIBTR|nr:tandem zinc finger protein 9 [Hibiscus trionum]